MSVVKRSESQLIGPIPGVPAVTLTLSVLLCIGAMSDGSTAASVLARSLQRHGVSASERESVASLLSSLNEAARTLCRHQAGQSARAVTPDTDLLVDQPVALRHYDPPEDCDSGLQVLPQLLNLPPPAATI